MTFFKTLAHYGSWRKPWLWLLVLFAVYSLGLGVIAPKLLERQLQSLMQERLNLELTVADIAINPFTLTLSAQNVRLQGSELTQPFGFDELLVNFQLSSLWRRAWSFRELHLLGFYGEFQRYTDGSSNISRLGETWLATAPPQEPEIPQENPTELPRLLIADLQLQITQVQIADQVPTTAFATQAGPLTLSIRSLSTLPEDKGQHTLHVQTPTGLQLSWQGEISLNPFTSRGSVDFSGPVFPMIAHYLQDKILFAVPSGHLATRFDYELAQNPADQPWQVALTSLAVDVTELQLQHKSTQATLFELPALTLQNGSVRWPEQTVELPLIELREGKVWPTLQADGNLNLTQLLVPETQATQATEAATDNTWTLNVPQVRLSDWQIQWSDQTLRKPAAIALKKLQLEISGFNTHVTNAIQLQSQFELDGGQVTVSGSLQPIPLAELNLDFQITNLPLMFAQSYLEEQALIKLAQGTVTANGKVSAPTLETLTLSGQVTSDNLMIEELESAKKILGWTQLVLEEIKLSINPPLTLAIKRINLQQPYTDFAVAADGSHTLNRVLHQQKNAPPTNTTPSPDPEIQIGSIQVQGGSGVFSDASLPLPFSAQIQNLNGTVSTLDSSSRTPAKMRLQGQVGEYGQVQISGRLLPLKPEQNTQLTLLFENLDIPDFSPYAVKFAGREIASGKLDLDLEYQVKNSKLVGENAMVLHDFSLGKKIDQPGATDLPLDLAVALLRDSAGRISLDVPVSGDMNDPQFDYGKVMGQALRKVLTSIVTSPFRLLGKLAGSESKQFGRVVFVPGSPEVSPPQREKLHQLATILQQRPDLLLEIPAGYSTSRDTSPMRTQQFLQKVQQQLDEELDLLEPRHLRTLEKLYEDQQLTPATPALRQKYLRTPEGKTALELDQLAYGTNLRNALVKNEILPEDALINLGAARRTHIHQVILAAAPELAERVALTPGGEMPGKEKEKKVYINLGLVTQP